MRIVLLPCLLCGSSRTVVPAGYMYPTNPAAPRLRQCAPAAAPTEADELSGTKKDRECLRGLDFDVQGTPRERAAILRSALATVKDNHSKLPISDPNSHRTLRC